MSFSFTIAETIAATPDRVYAVCTDLDRAGDWMNGLVRIEWLTDGGFREGARWREVRKMFGKDAAEEFLVRALVPNESFTLWVDGSKVVTATVVAKIVGLAPGAAEASIDRIDSERKVKWWA